ncbi:MAG: hypothetical protein WKF64_08450 [Ilumatobacteraceae bacterium]
MSRAVRTRARRQCSTHSCGCVARYESLATQGRYCPDHAAELAPYVILRPIEGYDPPDLTVIEGAA